VIAMQFEIADEVAGTFAHEFYGALSDGYPIDAALTEARKAIFATGRDVEWGTPVLYLRAPDGRIFDVQGGIAAAATPAVGRSPTVISSAPPPDARHRAARLLQSAGVALAHGEYVEALKLLHQAGTLDARSPALRELLDMAEQQRAVAETRASRRKAFLNELAAAAERLAAGDPTAAQKHVREALRLESKDPEALALRARIRQAVERAGPRKPRDTRAGTRPPHVSRAEVIVAGPTESRVRTPTPPSSPPDRGPETPRPGKRTPQGGPPAATDCPRAQNQPGGKTPQDGPRAATGRPRGQKISHDESDLLD
jgi:hypothetical protein